MDVGAAGGITGLLMMLVFGGAIGIGGTILWIWMLVECATKEPSEGNDKIIWILVILLAGWIGALIYFLARRPKRRAAFGQ